MGFRWNSVKLSLVALLVAFFAFFSMTRIGHRIAIAVFSPVSSSFSFVSRVFINGVRVLIPGTAGKEDRLRQLRAENLALKVQLKQHEQQTRKYLQLRHAVNLPVALPWRVIPGEVIARPPERWDEIMTVNRGSADNVQVGSAVLLDNGNVLGRVVECNRHNCQVATVLASECRFGVILPGKTMEASGIMQGNTAARYRDDGIGFVVDYLPRNLMAKDGDLLVTSGLGGNMPYGLSVGVVQDSVYIEGELRGKLKARPCARFGVVDMVFIVSR